MTIWLKPEPGIWSRYREWDGTMRTVTVAEHMAANGGRSTSDYNDDTAGCTAHDDHNNDCARCLIAAGSADDVTDRHYVSGGPNAGQLHG